MCDSLPTSNTVPRYLQSKPCLTPAQGNILASSLESPSLIPITLGLLTQCLTAPLKHLNTTFLTSQNLITKLLRELKPYQIKPFTKSKKSKELVKSNSNVCHPRCVLYNNLY